MIIDSHHPRWWFADHVTLTSLSDMIHMRWSSTLKVLEEEQIPVYRIPHGSRWSHFIPAHYVPRLRRKYGSDAARALRRRRMPMKPKGLPLQQRCPHCGLKGRQWRMGFTSAGNRTVRCGGCGRAYVMGARPPLHSTCPRCGAADRQWRMGYKRGKRQVKCAHCGHYYALQNDPDAAVRQPVEHVIRPPMPEPDGSW